MKIERITDLERQYAMQSLDGRFEAHNNYKFVVRLEKAFAENGIQVPYPQVDVHVKQ